jgi:hypothetical protein
VRIETASLLVTRCRGRLLTTGDGNVGDLTSAGSEWRPLAINGGRSMRGRVGLSVGGAGANELVPFAP